MRAPFIVTQKDHDRTHIIIIRLRRRNVGNANRYAPCPHCKRDSTSMVTRVVDIIPRLRGKLAQRRLRGVLPTNTTHGTLSYTL